MLNFENFKELIDESWHEDLKPLIESKEIEEIYSFLKNEAMEKKGKIFPKSKDIWKPFKYCKKQDLKVVFIGLSPYHNKVNNIIVADGLSFSCGYTKKEQPSLKLLLDSIEENCDIKGDRNPDLTYLAQQGVLLLNYTLTVEENKPDKHLNLWKPFYSYLYENVFSSMKDLIFIYFGKEAEKLSKLESPFIHYNKILSHPAFFARNKEPFEHENVWVWINEMIEKNKGKDHVIEWFLNSYRQTLSF